MQYVTWWPQIMVSMVKFDGEIDAMVIKLGFVAHVIQKIWKSKSLRKYFNSKYFFWERFLQHRKYLDLTTVTHYTVHILCIVF